VDHLKVAVEALEEEVEVKKNGYADFLLKSRIRFYWSGEGMNLEIYEIMEKLDKISDSMESIAESQKKITDLLESLVKEK